MGLHLPRAVRRYAFTDGSEAVLVVGLDDGVSDEREFWGLFRKTIQRHRGGVRLEIRVRRVSIVFCAV